jgi:hypothetical protein
VRECGPIKLAGPQFACVTSREAGTENRFADIFEMPAPYSECAFERRLI